MANLTERERAMLRLVARNEYNDEDPTRPTWAWFVCEDRADAAVFGSLIRKGLVTSQGQGDDASCQLTPAGLEVLRTL